MDMKKIVMAATLLSIVTGGEVSALAAKTTHQSVAKITHVKVTKHKVTGYTTAKSHIKLMKLKHGEKASATANKKGKFTVKVKNNNLTKLKFKIKATKPGLKARTYTHKVKKAVQAIDNSVTTETPASTTPAKPDEGKKPEKDKESKPSVSVVHVVDTQTAQDKITKAHEKLVAAKNELEHVSNLSYNKTTFDSLFEYAKAQHQALTSGKQEDKNAFDGLKAKDPYTASNKSFATFIDGLPTNPAAYKTVIDYYDALTNWNKIKNTVTNMPELASSVHPGNSTPRIAN